MMTRQIYFCESQEYFYFNLCSFCYCDNYGIYQKSVEFGLAERGLDDKSEQ